jgi:hypothetical protein
MSSGSSSSEELSVVIYEIMLSRADSESIAGIAL